MKFEASLRDLEAMIHCVAQAADEVGFDQAAIHKIELAAEEALVNVISYAYPKGGFGAIEIECNVVPDQELIIVIRDGGKPFDPLKEGPSADPEKGLEEREVGGWGIALLRKMVDEVTYARRESCNELTLVKHLHK